MKSSLLRVFWALLISVLVLLVMGGLIYFVSHGENVLAEAVRQQYADKPSVLDDITSETSWQLIKWCVLAASASWICASVWLLIAERHRPSTPIEGAEKLGSWVILLVINLTAMAAIGWSLIFSKSVQLDMSAGALTMSMILVGVASFLAYYLSTAMSVKPTMRPSVPLSRAFPNFSKV